MLKTLIDNAAAICGSNKALAQRIGITEPALSSVKAGRRYLTPEQSIGLAHILGIDPKALLAEVTIEREQDPEKRGRLREAFFPRGIAGGLAILLLCIGIATDRAEAQDTPLMSKFDKPIIVNIWQRLIAWAKSVLMTRAPVKQMTLAAATI